ncbi:gustatory receptor 5a for trehalose-like [Plodia interpunctella]|uniref:gustatory receptor 5a for trehalose-like n=1 Tax=Plodia interpunctella TaxID=58824 RepID=UPI0031010AFE
MNNQEKRPLGPSHWELYKMLEVNNFISMYTKKAEVEKTNIAKSGSKGALDRENNAWTVVKDLFLFAATTSFNTIIFIFIARKWPTVMKQITYCKLDEYIDQRVIFRSTVITIAIVIVGPIECALNQLALYTHILDCTPREMIDDPFRMLMMKKDNWIFDAEHVPYSFPLGIIIQVFNLIMSLNWSYPDIFISCICLYLVSIFDKINEKIDFALDKSLESWFWRSVREDYTQATRLVRMFDEVLSGITFVSLANHLFCICLQVYNILQISVKGGTKQKFPLKGCPNYPSGIFNGNEYTLYLACSIFLLVFRFLSVCLIGSRVHSAATQPSIALHGVPTKFYCTEIQRFIEQIHSDDIALSGLQFFNITRSLILPVAGTIITYELVLLQFNDE